MQYRFLFVLLKAVLGALVLTVAPVLPSPSLAADAGFDQFITSLWPEAQAAGVSRATFDGADARSRAGLQTARSDPARPPATGAPSQAEFVQVPADYIKEASIIRLAAEGQRLLAKYRPSLTAIEVPIRRARDHRARDLGPRNRLRPLRAAL